MVCGPWCRLPRGPCFAPGWDERRGQRAVAAVAPGAGVLRGRDQGWETSWEAGAEVRAGAEGRGARRSREQRSPARAPRRGPWPGGAIEARSRGGGTRAGTL